MDKIVVTDLSLFGHRELNMANELLTAMCEQGVPKDFEYDEIQLMFNTHSGYVFLINSNWECAMMRNGNLESFYSCGLCGAEGFRDEIDWNDKHQCCGNCL